MELLWSGLVNGHKCRIVLVTSDEDFTDNQVIEQNIPDAMGNESWRPLKPESAVLVLQAAVLDFYQRTSKPKEAPYPPSMIALPNVGETSLPDRKGYGE